VASDTQPNITAALLREIVATMIRRDDPGLSVYQMAVFLTCYQDEGEQTVRGLAQTMGASKAGINRAFDKLVERGLLARRTDTADGRAVYAAHTEAGAALMAEFADIAATFHKQAPARAA